MGNIGLADNQKHRMQNYTRPFLLNIAQGLLAIKTCWQITYKTEMGTFQTACFMFAILSQIENTRNGIVDFS